jgi:hypothetical protein
MKKLAYLLALIILPAPAFSQIAVSGTPTEEAVSTSSVTPEAGANRLVLWGAAARSTTTSAATDCIVSATYNAVSAPIAGTAQCYNNTGVAMLSNALFYAKEANLPGGAANYVVTFNGTTPANFRGAAMTLTGVDQSTTVQDTDVLTGSVNSDPHTLSVEATEGGMAVWTSICTNDYDETELATEGYSIAFEDETGANNYLMAYKPITSTGTESVT